METLKKTNFYLQLQIISIQVFKCLRRLATYPKTNNGQPNKISLTIKKTNTSPVQEHSTTSTTNQTTQLTSFKK